MEGEERWRGRMDIVLGAMLIRWARVGEIWSEISQYDLIKMASSLYLLRHP